MTAVVLQGRACVIGISPLREALRSRPDLRVDTWRLTVETDTCVAPTGERPTLRAKIGGIISRSKYSADAVAQPSPGRTPRRTCVRGGDRSFERSLRPLNLRQLVCDARQHDLGRLGSRKRRRPIADSSRRTSESTVSRSCRTSRSSSTCRTASGSAFSASMVCVSRLSSRCARRKARNRRQGGVRTPSGLFPIAQASRAELSEGTHRAVEPNRGCQRSDTTLSPRRPRAIANPACRDAPEGR